MTKQSTRLVVAAVFAVLLVILARPTTINVHALSYYDPVPGCVAHAQAYFVGPPTEPHFTEEIAHWTAHCQAAYWMHNGAVGVGGCFMAGIAAGIYGIWTGAACSLIVWG